MAEKDFLRTEARTEARRAVEDVELRTSAEVLLAVRRVSGRYREADYLLGFLLALATLLALLFLPQPFALWTFPLDVAASFALGSWLSTRLPSVRRLLTPASVRTAAVQAAAQVEFTAMRLSRLPNRNAILVYVSLLERTAVVLPDLGIEPDRIGPGWSDACRRLQAAVARLDWSETLLAFRELGPTLAEAYPRATDDVNELSDEVLQP